MVEQEMLKPRRWHLAGYISKACGFRSNDWKKFFLLFLLFERQFCILNKYFFKIFEETTVTFQICCYFAAIRIFYNKNKRLYLFKVPKIFLNIFKPLLLQFADPNQNPVFPEKK